MEEASGPPIDIWPDNMPTVSVFAAMATQWRIGMNGVTGLDYNPLPGVLRLMGVTRADWPEVFDGIRIMEQAALNKMHEKA